MTDLKIVALKNIKEQAIKINEILNQNRIKSECILLREDRFNNGEGKTTLKEDVSGNVVYLMSDVGNYGITYKMRGFTIPMSPDEHFMDLKRAISSINNKSNPNSLNVIMPLLYSSRQHRIKSGESKDAAMALKELVNLGIETITTVDAHSTDVADEIPKKSFINIFPTQTLIKQILEENEAKDLIVISPDSGALTRAREFSEILNVGLESFEKGRSEEVINGNNKIISHIYKGGNISGKTALVVDDMIDSGCSILKTATKLKELGVKKVFFVTTFALLSKGKDPFIEAYNNGVFDKLYATNLTYVSEEVLKEEWFRSVDCSYDIANFISINSKNEGIPRKRLK